MKYLILFFTIISSFSCTEFDAPQGFRLKINKSELKMIAVLCKERNIWLMLNEKKSDALLNKINQAKSIGPIKGLVYNSLMIELKNGKKINLKITDNKFKWKDGKDWAFQLELEKDYFKNLCDLE